MVPEIFERASATGDLTAVVADHLNDNIWKVYDATALSGGPSITSDPTAFVTPGGVVMILAEGAGTGEGAR